MRFDFTKDEHDFFVEHCRFNPENGEIVIFEMRCAGKSIVEISLATNMSTATVSRRISNIKNKMQRVKPDNFLIIGNRSHMQQWERREKRGIS